ncbi:MAG: hypothetical protein ACYTGP_11120 [Planctomycetota bacterium]
MNIELVDEERDALTRLLESAIADLRVEVRRTRTPSFHDGLVEEGEVLKRVLKKIRD